MHSVFNSLGSNYTLSFSLMSLGQLFFPNKKSGELLQAKLSELFDGQSVLTYKGRDAITIACQVLLPKKSKVFTQAFTCYAVEEGIVRAGMIPVYVDIDDGVNMSVASLEQAYSKHPDVRAVLVQHSLGMAADSKAIRKWCSDRNVFLIEDIAQAFGAVDLDNERIGKKGDAVVLSFGRDKVIDAVSGGAVIFKNVSNEQQERLEKLTYTQVPRSVVIGDLLYPISTFLIRSLHGIGIGKLLFVLFKQMGLLTSPLVSKVATVAHMPAAYAQLVLTQLATHESMSEHRKKIALYYKQELQNIAGLTVLHSTKSIQHSSNLRFPIVTTKWPQVVAELKKSRVYISDRWYRSAVDCGTLNCKSSYIAGSCPNAEKMADTILTLPTHRGISLTQAERICKVIKKLHV